MYTAQMMPRSRLLLSTSWAKARWMCLSTSGTWALQRPSALHRPRNKWRSTTLVPSAPCKQCCHPCAQPKPVWSSIHPPWLGRSLHPSSRLQRNQAHVGGLCAGAMLQGVALWHWCRSCAAWPLWHWVAHKRQSTGAHWCAGNLWQLAGCFQCNWPALCNDPASDAAPKPQLVVDAYLALADIRRQTPHTHRSQHHLGRWRGERSQAVSWSQPIQDCVLKEMQLEGVLGGTDA